MTELQAIPARHGIATFVPAGHVIKIVNTSGAQVVSMWAFVLGTPEVRDGDGHNGKEEQVGSSGGKSKLAGEQGWHERGVKQAKEKDLPSQDEAERATHETLAEDGVKAGATKLEKNKAGSGGGWTTYLPTGHVPSVPMLGLGMKKTNDASAKEKTKIRKNNAEEVETEQQRNSRTWASYFPSGKSFSSYIPKTATDTVSAFARDHQRNTSKPYLEQLQDFSKTPVGAAGMAVATGSGYSSSLYAGYQAWNASHATSPPAMEFLSIAHTRTAMLRLRPCVGDTMVSNLRAPMLTMIEDSSRLGVHDTLIPACDPTSHRGLDGADWAHRRSCAENHVLALQVLNERAGLKGPHAVGADVTINTVPAPLNLWRNVSWDEAGNITSKATASDPGAYVRLRAERDIVVVLSACPDDVQAIHGEAGIADAHFVVEAEHKEEEEEAATAREAIGQEKQPKTPEVKKHAKRASTQTGSAAMARAKSTASRDVDAKTNVPVERKRPRKLRPRGGVDAAAAAAHHGAGS